MNYTYLLCVAIVLIPIVLSFKKQFNFFGDLKAFLPAVLIAGCFFLGMKLIFANLGVLVYDQSENAGVLFFEVPMPEVTLCFSLPFFFLTVYNFFNGYFPDNSFDKYSLSLSNVFLGLSIAIIFFAYTKIYTIVIFSTFLLFLFFVEYLSRIRFMYKYYRAAGILLFLYAVANVFFVQFNPVSYRAEQTIKFRLVNVPFENYFLILGVVLLVTYVFEFIKRRNYGAAGLY